MTDELRVGDETLSKERMREAIEAANSAPAEFIGDKRAWCCEACADKAIASDAREPEQSDEQRMDFLAKHWQSTVEGGERLHDWLADFSTLMTHGSLRAAIDHQVALAASPAPDPGAGEESAGLGARGGVQG